LWVVKRIEEALDEESSPIARSQLQAILENLEIAGTRGLPICQDTGLPIFHIEEGRDAVIPFDLRDAVADGVRQATIATPLRPNVVDPLNRRNTGDNTGEGMPHLIVDRVEGYGLRITAFPKGAGSENMSFIGMLNPADDPNDFLLGEIGKRAMNACPPIFVGVGIGGTFDLAASLSKRALLNMPGSSGAEVELQRRINRLGIGPMGLGGDTTALGVKIELASCHTASLPVAANLQCWANRSATVVVDEDGWRCEGW
jgi:fumarate hydratase subunit alpha